MSRSGFGGLKKTFAIITVFALFMTVMSVWVKPEQVRAAAKTTVRVATSKQLKSALKDPNVGTIILRTATVDPITISSKKAKKKNLIVDAEESVITNKTKFKSITIVNVAGYIEDVSGNKITLNTNRAFEVAAGRSVKKLTFDNVSPWLPLRYVLRDNASIKKIAFKDDGKVKDLGDGKFSVKKSVYEDEEYNVADYVMEFTFDKSGRITEETSQNVSTDPDNEYNHIYKYEYYDNGNLYRLTTSNPVWAYDLTVESYYYDENNNMTGYSEEYDDRPVCSYDYEYDDAGRMTSCRYIDEIRSREYKYSYDKKGRLVEEDGYFYDYVYGEEGLEEELTRSYTSKTTYTKQGYELKITYDWGGDADAVKSVVTYTYDKAGNRTTYMSEDYYDSNDPSNNNVYRNEYEYDELGELLNVYYVDSDGRRVNMDDIAG